MVTEDDRKALEEKLRQQARVMHHVPEAHLAGEAQLVGPGHSGMSEMLAQVLSRPHRVAGEPRIETQRPQLPRQ